ncbi:TRAP transporter small permease [Marinobacter bohaiensis]|uniref:TRAP transporter small permease n=1 Tax=Marinobacter bohaiensis TaxID=2201898 RepID=UPI0013A6B455|nr:TRAP transporter small permease [Marinobacter bohaiensis]
MARLERLEIWFVRANQALIAAAMAGMAILVMANVLCRYGFGVSLPWTEELSRFLMIAVTYLGAGLALREGRLVAVEFLQDLFPRFLMPLRLLVALIIMVFLVVLAWVGVGFAQFAAGQETPVLGISASIPYMIIPVGASMLALHLVLILRDFLARNWHTDGPEGSTASHHLEYGQE